MVHVCRVPFRYMVNFWLGSQQLMLVGKMLGYYSGCAISSQAIYCWQYFEMFRHATELSSQFCHICSCTSTVGQVVGTCISKSTKHTSLRVDVSPFTILEETKVSCNKPWKIRTIDSKKVNEEKRALHRVLRLRSFGNQSISLVCPKGKVVKVQKPYEDQKASFMWVKPSRCQILNPWMRRFGDGEH